ncbi:hypothetical protein PX699_21640 [Sphingobium sp. H39-3-25]|uniref:tetratricopeptide repeat protein n=1 Tax=Sphingobium arseniciresistens TaxID=3030834 RepID=UPI0023B97F4E|nr:hypothetical protein [Sphingobium arseniciresistens]
MTRLYGAAGQQDGAPKLEITLFGSRGDLEELGLRNIRAEEGPFARSFSNQRYYDPRADGAVLAIARSDQLVDLNTSLAHDRFCEDLAAQGTDCIGKREPYLPPVVRSWESIVYSAFAQHFILSNVPAPYPRWYLDGIGALFSTIEVRKDGSLDYAKPPELSRQVFRSYGDVNARDVLTGGYFDWRSRRMTWTPYHAWLITHFFVFSNPKPALQAQFAQYMAAIRQGAPLAEAARVFKDPGRLNREIMGYASRAKAYATSAPSVVQGTPLVAVLSPVQVTTLKAKLRLGNLPPPDASGSLPEADHSRSASLAWISTVRAEATQAPFDVGAMLVATEAECRAALSEECRRDANRVLAQEPGNVRALAWKGIAQTDEALTGPADDRDSALAAARETIALALQSDPRNPVAAIANFQSYARAGAKVPDAAVAILAKLAAAVPGAPTPRMLLGSELIRQGKPDLARKLLGPVLYGPYDSPEKKAAQVLLSASTVGTSARAGELGG